MKTTWLPSPEILAMALQSLLGPPEKFQLRRVVVPVSRSRRKTSAAPFVSPGTRFDAVLVKAT
jgi:hypothetical protein